MIVNYRRIFNDAAERDSYRFVFTFEESEIPPLYYSVMIGHVPSNAPTSTIELTTICCHDSYFLAPLEKSTAENFNRPKEYHWICSKCESVKSKRLFLSNNGYDEELKSKLLLTRGEDFVNSYLIDFLAHWFRDIQLFDDFTSIIEAGEMAEAVNNVVREINKTYQFADFTL